jgi:transcriptional regulator with XRE-family HTH domain
MRMRQPAADVHSRARGPASPARMPDGASGAVANRDQQVGQIFRNMRAAMRLPREAIARRLATTPGTIEDLENGAVASLPRWPETVRIVRSYCELLRLDPEPVLWRIHRQLQTTNGLEDSGTRTGTPVPPQVLLRNQPKSRPSNGKRRQRRARRMFAFSAPLALAAAAFYFAQAAPAPIYRTIALLPQPVEGGARAVMDNILLYSAPRRDGLRWIDVGDPRLRKVDKLHTSVR